ncbi:MAG: response regulator [Polyangiaceae bacterium]
MTRESASTRSASDADRQGKARVLLVDDDPRLLLALREGLRRRMPHVHVETCASATKAIEELTNADYDAVITDVVMPGIDGLSLLDRIRELRPACVTVLMSGIDERDLALRALRGGAYDLLHKPVDLDDFSASVERVLEVSRLRRDNEAQQAALARHAEQLEVALKQAVEVGTHELREAHRIKDEFLAVVSHELRTPLTAILGWARLLRMGGLDEATQRKAFESIERNASSQSQIVDDLLEVSRIITGKLRLRRQRLDPAALLESCVDAIVPDAQQKGVEVQRHIDASAPAVSADAQRLRQVFWNLLSNAIKFTPSGGHIRVGLRSRAGSTVEVEVQDDGVGIRPEFLPFVFDRFTQDEAAREGSRRGIGVGLAIVRHLVQEHGGTVAARSAGEGKGATFVVGLPFGEGDTAWDESEARVPEALLDPRHCLKGVRVLLVDDDAAARDLLLTLLRRAGGEVICAAGAGEARAAMVAERIDLLLCDIQLPDEDGYALLRWVRARPADEGGAMPAVALTATASAEHRARALTKGFQMLVPKPGPSDLALLLASLLRRRPGT